MNATRILIVDDEKDLLELLVKRLTRKGYDVKSAGTAEDAILLLNKYLFDIAIYDIRLPKMDGITLLRKTKTLQPETEIVMLTGHGTIDTAIEAMKLGAFDYLTKPYNLSKLEVTIQIAEENKQIKQKNDNLKNIMRKQNEFEIIGASPKIKEVIELTKRIADSEVPVLIYGESGTGKELFAKGLHYWSCRAEEPFVAINSGALSDHLLESELFGHVKGAFTGADTDKKGLVEAADGGSLFLDELGEMPLALQVKLLRFLESGEFRRVGDVRERKVNVRIIAATNRNIEEEVENGRFRNDLYYRLNVVKLTIPPLRERKEDIPLLINYFIKQRKSLDKEFSTKALLELQNYDFPGNVRELNHLIERGILLSRSNKIEIFDLQLPSKEAIHPSESEKGEYSLEKIEKAHIEQVLRTVNGNKTKAAGVLGISVRNLYRKIDQFTLKE